MWPWFDSRTRRHMWVVFVVGSHPYSEGFSPGSPVFLPSQKPTLLNSYSIGNFAPQVCHWKDRYVGGTSAYWKLKVVFVWDWGPDKCLFTRGVCRWDVSLT